QRAGGVAADLLRTHMLDFRRRRSLKKVLTGLIFSFFCAALALVIAGVTGGFINLRAVAYAQSATATLSGTVVDDREAFVSGAEVTIVNPATGLKRTTKTNDAGYYFFPALAPGGYTVTTQRSGFAPAEAKDVILNVNDQRSLRIQLRVGQVGETITVSSDAGAIKEDPAAATVVDRELVSNLPLKGRTLETLISLTPGAVITGATSQNPGQFSVNGQRTSSNYFTVDGVSANFGSDNFAGYNPAVAGAVPATNIQGGFSNLVSIDALQEFKIQTSTFSPEFGRSPGAQVSLVTRSGENQFHGSAYDYF